MRLVTRSLARAMGRNIRSSSIRIARNRRLDAAALQQRRVVINRRASAIAPVQANQVPQNLNVNRSLVVVLPSNNRINRSISMEVLPNAVPSNVLPKSNENDSAMDIEANDPPAHDDQVSSVALVDSEHANESQSDVLPPIDLPSATVAPANSEHHAEDTNDSTLNPDQANGLPNTFFPGYARKPKRKSFFDQNRMDEYVSKLKPVRSSSQVTPARVFRRRHSTMPNAA